MIFLHNEKSVLQPTKILDHLGFRLNSIDMTVSITEQKNIKI